MVIVVAGSVAGVLLLGGAVVDVNGVPSGVVCVPSIGRYGMLASKWIISTSASTAGLRTSS